MKGVKLTMSDERYYNHHNHNYCPPVQPTMMVCQLVGQGQQQESLTICVRVPRGKPKIEQVVDVYVKNIKITSINVVYNKVIVRGKFELKVLYVACKPNQPVHAIEMHNVHFTASVDIRGACPGMEAEATVRPEFVDYDCDKNTRAGWYKHKDKWDHEHDCDCKEEESCDSCETESDSDSCDYDTSEDDSCDDSHSKPCKPCKPHKPCKPCKPPKPCKPGCYCKKPKKGAHECHVSVVLQVIAKVFTMREILIQTGGLPQKPKG